MSNSSGPRAIEEAPAARVLLVVPPFHQAFIPSLGVSLLKAALVREDIACDVLYLNVRFAEHTGPDSTRSRVRGRIGARRRLGFRR